MKVQNSTTHDSVVLVSAAALPTRYGEFIIHVFRDDLGHEHVALVRGDVEQQERVPVRMHSECLTGDAFASLRCDCREQLELALETIGKLAHGVVLYLRQEGRGIGLGNKIRAYALQQNYGLDTIDANLALGFREDQRDYGVAADMLHELGVKSIRLLTNNPDKVQQLQDHDVHVDERVPHEIVPGSFNEDYLETKKTRAGHFLTLDRKRSSS